MILQRSPEILERSSQDELLLLRNDVMTVYRPVRRGGSELFPLRYVRHSPRRAIPGNPPVLYLQDGPGLAAVLPFYTLRRSLAHADLDVIMVEPRGVGLSRLTDTGRDLPREAMHLDLILADILAVLDRAMVEKAVVMGTGYGGYLAQALAALHPERVHSLVLDTPRTGQADELAAQFELRRLYWHGDDVRTATIARTLRRLIDSGELEDPHAGPIIQTIHEYGGVDAVRDIVDLLARDGGALTWNATRQLLLQQILQSTPYVIEHDLVAPVAHTELGIGASADGQPLDPLSLLAVRARGLQPFEGEQLDVVELASRITAPTLLLAGERDAITPLPIARALVDRIDGAQLLVMRDAGHSVIPTSVQAGIIAARWSVAGQQVELAARAAELSAAPRTGAVPSVRQAIRLALQAERISPLRLRAEQRLLGSRRPDPSSRGARRARL